MGFQFQVLNQEEDATLSYDTDATIDISQDEEPDGMEPEPEDKCKGEDQENKGAGSQAAHAGQKRKLGSEVCVVGSRFKQPVLMFFLCIVSRSVLRSSLVQRSLPLIRALRLSALSLMLALNHQRILQNHPSPKWIPWNRLSSVRYAR